MYICKWINNVTRHLTWTTFDTNIGNIDKGKRNMLNKDKDTNAVCASKIWLSSDNTYTAKVTNDT